MNAIITRRNFMRGAGVAALAAGSVMLTGCSVSSIIENAIEDTILKQADAIKLGKYIVANVSVVCNSSANNSMAISFDIYNADDKIIGKEASALISDISINGTAVDSTATDSTTLDAPESDVVMDPSYAWVSYYISQKQYSALFENGKELKFTVTLPDAGSAIYTVTYKEEKTSEGNTYSVSAKAEKKS